MKSLALLLLTTSLLMCGCGQGENLNNSDSETTYAEMAPPAATFKETAEPTTPSNRVAEEKSEAATSMEDLVVSEGDTYERVSHLLGEPNVEYSKDGNIHRWYVGYKLVFTSNVVVSVERRPDLAE